jgi:hypothetical protein
MSLTSQRFIAILTNFLQDNPLLTWTGYRERYLDAILCLEGRGSGTSKGCATCGKPDPIYRCRDCHLHRLMCQECILDRHSSEPLHVIEVCIDILSKALELTNISLQRWTSNRFQRISLSTLGLRIQLGHSNGICCPLASQWLSSRICRFLQLQSFA